MTNETRLQNATRFIALAALTVVAFAFTVSAADNPLPSWNDGPAKRSIVDFVSKVTKEGSPDFVPPAARIATFDNDGTLWSEQPLYFQFLFAIDRVKALAPQHLRAVTDCAGTVFQSIAVLSRDTPAPVASAVEGVVDPARLRSALDRLRATLETSDPTATETALAALAEVGVPEHLRSDVGRVRALAGDYEFDEAGAIVARLSRTLSEESAP
jgi:hypothetical protein